MTIFTGTLDTVYAPAARASLVDLQAQATFFESMTLIESLLSAVPNSVLVLNSHRQIVYANTAFLELFNFPNVQSIVGMRPGEAINCEHAFLTIGGCGTAEHCSTCGAVNSILKAQAGQKNSSECRISTKNEDKNRDSLDLRVSSTPHYFKNEQFTVFTLSDISSEKRRRVLERLFFHDITNTAGAIYGMSELLNDAQTMEDLHALGFNEMLSAASKQLIDEIQAQRQLSEAENGELTIKADYFYSNSFLQTLINTCKNHSVAANKVIELHSESENVLLLTDHTVLSRIIGNMIKNALEASTPGETVTVGCHKMFDYVQIWVHNPQFMPKRVQLQIFQRSFSTKGNGRGLGTYSMKLFTEKYLQGHISFESSRKDGTVFMGMFPLELDESADED